MSSSRASARCRRRGCPASSNGRPWRVSLASGSSPRASRRRSLRISPGFGLRSASRGRLAAGSPSARPKRRAGRIRSWPRAGGVGRRASDWASGGSPRSSHEPSAPAGELLALGELRQRGRDRRAAGADQLAEDPVRERQRDDHAVAGHAAPALGEVPEQRLQAAVDARELGDRLGRGQPQRALAEAVEQRSGDLGIAAASAAKRRSSTATVSGESTVQTASTGSRPAPAGGLPGAHEIARAEQLGADVVGDDELA